MDDYLRELIKYGRIAYNTGQQMIASPNKRKDSVRWTIQLKTIVAQGEDKIDEDII